MPTPLITAALVSLSAMQQVPGPEPETLKTLEYQILEAFDYGAAIELPKLPSDRAADQAVIQWLHSAVSLSIPISTFAADSLEQSEAAEIIRFLNTAAVPPVSAFNELSLRLSGSQLALWRFGQASARSGKWGASVRRSWENRLMDSSIHPMIRGFAVRHALCWALAENDEARLADLKNSKIGEDAPLIFSLFQKTFASLDNPLTALRLWTSSFSEVSDAGALGAGLWICPDPDMPPPSPVSVWIIPILGSPLKEGADNSQWKTSAEQFLKTPVFSDYKVFFAPFQKDLDLLGIALFPVLIEQDSVGNVKSIRMGDACPRAG